MASKPKRQSKNIEMEDVDLDTVEGEPQASPKQKSSAKKQVQHSISSDQVVSSKHEYFGPPDVYLRIEEVRGIPSPNEGQTADVHFQLDFSSKRTNGSTTIITGGAPAAQTSCQAAFHEDFIITRRDTKDPLLLTLRSKALGFNASFGKLLLSLDDLLQNCTGAPGEPIHIAWHDITPSFKSVDQDVTYNLQVKLIAKAVENNRKLHEQHLSLTACPTSLLYIMNDPRGTLAGNPIESLLFLHRSIGAEKIAKGSLLVDSVSEENTFVDGKLFGKKRGFFSAGEPLKHVYPGISAYIDQDAGLLERAAQEVLAKAAGNNSSALNSPDTVKRALSVTELGKSPRVSQRASLLFRGAPKVTEFDEVAHTFAWKMKLPVPNIVTPGTADSIVLPPSVAISEDGSNPFQPLTKSSHFSAGVLHVVNARCGILEPAQSSFIVHPFKRASEPLMLSAEVPDKAGQLNITAQLVNADDHPHKIYVLELEIDASNCTENISNLVATIQGTLQHPPSTGESISSWNVVNKEWKAEDDENVVIRKGQTSSLIVQIVRTDLVILVVSTATWSSNNIITIVATFGDSHQVTLSGNIPVIYEHLAEKLASIDPTTLSGVELDSLHMNSSAFDASNVVAIPALSFGGNASMYHPETGEPIEFDCIGELGGKRSARSKRKSKKDKSQSSPTSDVANTATSSHDDSVVAETTPVGTPKSKRKSKRVTASAVEAEMLSEEVKQMEAEPSTVAAEESPIGAVEAPQEVVEEQEINVTEESKTVKEPILSSETQDKPVVVKESGRNKRRKSKKRS